ncbi:hypothetical protein EVA_08559, partial [gut metagenome]
IRFDFWRAIRYNTSRQDPGKVRPQRAARPGRKLCGRENMDQHFEPTSLETEEALVGQISYEELLSELRF